MPPHEILLATLSERSSTCKMQDFVGTPARTPRNFA